MNGDAITIGRLAVELVPAVEVVGDILGLGLGSMHRSLSDLHLLFTGKPDVVTRLGLHRPEQSILFLPEIDDDGARGLDVYRGAHEPLGRGVLEGQVESNEERSAL